MTVTKTTTRAALMQKIASLPTSQIRDCLFAIGSGIKPDSIALTRALLFDEIERREGENGLDAIMSEMGM